MSFGHRSVRVFDLFDFRKGTVNPIQSSFKTLGFATKQGSSPSDQICHFFLGSVSQIYQHAWASFISMFFN